MTILDSISQSRDITLVTKVCLVNTMFFPVVMHGHESWNIKTAEHQELMRLNCGIREDSRESLGLKEINHCNQSILKEIIPEYSLEGQMLKLKRQYFGKY